MLLKGLPGGASGKEPACHRQGFPREDPLEEDMANHSSILAWRIPWMEEPGDYSPWGHKESDMTEVN